MFRGLHEIQGDGMLARRESEWTGGVEDKFTRVHTVTRTNKATIWSERS